MSTYWGYVCLSHEPNLASETWFNHGNQILADAYRLERAGKWPDDPAYGPDGPWNLIGPEPKPVLGHGDGRDVGRQPIYWLRDHPKCRVGLRNEYGIVEEIEDQP